MLLRVPCHAYDKSVSNDVLDMCMGFWGYRSVACRGLACLRVLSRICADIMGNEILVKGCTGKLSFNNAKGHELTIMRARVRCFKPPELQTTLFRFRASGILGSTSTKTPCVHARYAHFWNELLTSFSLDEGLRAKEHRRAQTPMLE